MSGPYKNTDKELWREREGDYYADSVHVTQSGAIGINCGGHVIVQPLRKWHEAAAPAEPGPTSLDPFNCPDCGAHDYGLYAGNLGGDCPHCLKREVSALEQTVSRLRADAERYRWLRDGNKIMAGTPGNRPIEWYAGTALDAAIDAALKKEPG